MPEGANVSHRPGLLKQQNKGHKHGKHRSKGALDNANKGKVGVKAITKRKHLDMKRDDRRRQMSQLRSKKREETIAKKRSLGGSSTPPFLVVLVPLGESANISRLVNEITTCDSDAVVSHSKQGLIHISLPRFRQRFSLLIPVAGDIYATLDACKAADTVLFVASPDADDVSCISDGTSAREGALGFDQYGQTLLTAIMAQGLPSPIFVFNDVDVVPNKKRGVWKKALQKQIERTCPLDKLFVLEKNRDAIRLLQHIGSQKQRPVFQRDHRSHLLAEELEFVQNPDDSTKGTLVVSGYVRYKALSVNGLVHIPGWGDFQMKKTEAPSDPFALKKSNSREESEGSAAEEYKLLETADPNLQESLQAENDIDPMSGEQTWPYSEEMQGENMEQEESGEEKKIKRVPKGTSTYQAAWIKDEDEEDEEDDDESGEEEEDEEGMEAEDNESEDEKGDDEKEEEEEEEDDGELESVDLTEEGDVNRYDKKVSFADDVEDLQKFKKAKEDQMFPDEVDTPREVSARVRFQKYRGLQSFRTSPWDPKENLPLDFSRIFQFENFTRTRKRLLKEETDGAQPGWYIRVHVKNVPSHLFASLPAKYPLVLVGILPNEQRMSVLNVLLKRPSEAAISARQNPIASKERLIVHCGFRRYAVRPIFSQHTSGNKHKYERFFRPETSVVATFFAPITFPPASVLAFQEKKDGSQQLVATGSVLSVNPDRVVVKRAVLSGHPFKVNRKSAVVRFMFFNREDIEWFKPVELKTKWGRRGHIREPLGTHGHMKCVFDGQLKSQDTVLMTLYKRVFPKWSYDPNVATPSPLFHSNHEVDMEENVKQLMS